MKIVTKNHSFASEKRKYLKKLYHSSSVHKLDFEEKNSNNPHYVFKILTVTKVDFALMVKLLTQAR